MKKIIAQINMKTLERLFFFAFVFYFSTTLFEFDYFITSDGPSHLYNANLIGDLIFNQSATANAYFELNTVIVPNWIGHLLLWLFNSVVESHTAEKLFLGVYFFGFFYSLRYLIRSFNPNHGFYALFFLPFALNVFLYSGFYNFCFAFIFLFLCLGYYTKNRDQLKFRQIGVLLFLFILLFFSHLLVFLATVVMLYFLLFWNWLLIKKPINTKWGELLRAGLKIGIAVLPAMLLAFNYWSSHGGAKVITYLSVCELNDMLVNVSPLLGHGAAEKEFAQFYLILLFGIILFSILYIILHKKWDVKLHYQQGIIGCAFLILILYYFMPDGDGKGAFVSIRILFLFFLLFTFLVSLLNLPHVFKVIFVLLIAVNTNSQQEIRQEGQRFLSDFAAEIHQVGELVTNNSVVLPINSSSNWMEQNLFNYLGPDKSLVFLMNYEGLHPFFPVCWKEKTPIQYAYSIKESNVCQTHLSLFNHFKILPDYLFFYGGNTPAPTCWPTENSEAFYTKCYESPYCQLFENKTHQFANQE